VSSERCRRSKKSRSTADCAFAANRPQVAAWRRCFKAFDKSGRFDMALSTLQAGAQLSLGHRRLGSSCDGSHADDREIIHGLELRT
jgi:hypothetical protein